MWPPVSAASLAFLLPPQNHVFEHCRNILSAMLQQPVALSCLMPSFHKSDQKATLGHSVLTEVMKQVCAINCSYLLKMSDSLPRSCHGLNKHLLAEDPNSGLDVIIRNCETKPMDGAAASDPWVLHGVVVLHRKLTCPAILSQLCGFCPAETPCS